MSVTAVVLSARPYARVIAGVDLQVRVGPIASPEDLQRERFAAIAEVRTSHFFFLDDDDDLPPDVDGVLERCLEARAAVAYTDELITDADGGQVVRRGGAYAQERHLRDPMLIHHLALCRTLDALEAIAGLPRGPICPELQLYWQLAKAGAVHVPEIGYVWHRRATGMHAWPATVISQMRAALWCKANP